jgi:hypothetical protein
VETIDDETDREIINKTGRIHLTHQEICPNNRSHPYPMTVILPDSARNRITSVFAARLTI